MKHFAREIWFGRLAARTALAMALIASVACARKTETAPGAPPAATETSAPPAAAAIAPPAALKGADPKINAGFLDPDVDRYVKMFELESREIFKHRAEIVKALELRPGMRVADVGAGTGFFARMIAREVGAEGKVFAVEISQKFLDHISAKAAEEGIKNIAGVLGDQHSTKLEPGSADLVFICDTYHHFEHPAETLASIQQALRPGGRLVIVDFERIVGVSPDFAIGHVRCGKGTVTDEVKDAGFDYLDEVAIMKEQYVIRFRKR